MVNYLNESMAFIRPNSISMLIPTVITPYEHRTIDIDTKPTISRHLTAAADRLIIELQASNYTHR